MCLQGKVKCGKSLWHQAEKHTGGKHHAVDEPETQPTRLPCLCPEDANAGRERTELGQAAETEGFFNPMVLI